jgi:hypothetical protein
MRIEAAGLYYRRGESREKRAEKREERGEISEWIRRWGLPVRVGWRAAGQGE